jgi:hypothetical protein
MEVEPKGQQKDRTPLLLLIRKSNSNRNRILQMKRKIIDNTLSRSASPDEARDVAAWFATEEGQEYLSLRYDREAYMLNDETIEEWEAQNVPSDRMRMHFTSWLHSRVRSFRFKFVAAALVPFLLLAGTLTFVVTRSGIMESALYASVQVPYGEQVHLVLQDGTHVQLNSGSKLEYPKNFGLFQRNVSLAGEGYFSVAKDRSRPFYVHAGDIDVKVTGTKFNVKAYEEDNSINVTLEEGSVTLMNGKTDLYAMNVYENAVYDKLSGTCKVENVESLSPYTAWRSRALNFYCTPLSEILKVLERQYDVRFIYSDSSLLKYKFSISTSKTNVSMILQDLEKVSDIRFTDDGNQGYIVSMKR